MKVTGFKIHLVICSFNKRKLLVFEKENLMELSIDSSLESDLKKYIYIIDFLIALKEEYEKLRAKAIKYLLHFTNTELACFILCI